MRSIIVDDEPIMLRYFMRESADIDGLIVLESFTSGLKALAYAKETPVDVAFLDVEMPDISGIDLAVKLRELRSDILIVFISAFDYVRDSNKIGGDYYLMKPYDKEKLLLMMERLHLLAQRQKKKLYIQMFGTFTVTYDGKPIPLKGKAKEILAFVAASRGKEVSNLSIYAAIWENKPCNNQSMTVYFHALRKLKMTLATYQIEDLLISNVHGQILNTDMVDCDYYAWLDNNAHADERFDGSFLSEYSWGEPLLADLVNLTYE